MNITEFKALTYRLCYDTDTEVPFLVTEMPPEKGGQCRGKIMDDVWYPTRIIFNQDYVRVIDYRQARHLILHEIAHFKCYPMDAAEQAILDPHGPHWVKQCRRLGIKARRSPKGWPIN